MSELVIKESNEGPGTILDLSGDLVMGDATVALRNAVRESLSAGARDMIIDLGDVVRMDSSGIGELISSLMAVNREGGRLVLRNLSERVHKHLAISEISEIFEIR